jgi:hypothetical protein
MSQRFLHKAQRLTKRILSPQTWISHKSYKPHKEVLGGGGAHNGLEMYGFRGWHQHPPKEGGEAFILASQKLAVRNWPVKTGTSSFRIKHLKFELYLLQPKPDPPVWETRLFGFP